MVKLRVITIVDFRSIIIAEILAITECNGSKHGVFYGVLLIVTKIFAITGKALPPKL